MAHVTREYYEALPYYESYPPEGSKCGAVMSEVFRSPATNRYNKMKLRGCESWVEKVVQYNRETGESHTECRPWSITEEDESA